MIQPASAAAHVPTIEAIARDRDLQCTSISRTMRNARTCFFVENPFPW